MDVITLFHKALCLSSRVQTACRREVSALGHFGEVLFIAAQLLGAQGWGVVLVSLQPGWSPSHIQPQSQNHTLWTKSQPHRSSQGACHWH